MEFGGFELGSDEDTSGMAVAGNVSTKEMAATEEGGHLDLELCACLYFYCRAMTRDTLPPPVRHLYPRIGPLDIQVDYLA